MDKVVGMMAVASSLKRDDADLGFDLCERVVHGFWTPCSYISDCFCMRDAKRIAPPEVDNDFCAVIEAQSADELGSDEEFEALLLEILSEFQISIPELGVRKAEVKPLVVLTSNNSREIGDALKRRCLHLYIPFPEAKLERQIVQARVPEISESLQIQLVNFVQGVRELDLKKQPAISETIDWAKTVILLNSEELDTKLAEDTLNILLKHQQDIEVVKKEIPALVSSATETSDGKSIN